MADDKKELLRKIKALAERGVGGEKENAEVLLKQLMDKYGITESDISDDVIKQHEVKISEVPFIKRLLEQIVYATVGNINSKKGMFEYTFSPRGRVCVCCTDAEFLEITAKYEFYGHHWKQDLETFYGAFIQSNVIFPPNELIKDREPSEMTDEDRKRLRLARNLDKHEYNKRITDGGKK